MWHSKHSQHAIQHTLTKRHIRLLFLAFWGCADACVCLCVCTSGGKGDTYILFLAVSKKGYAPVCSPSSPPHLGKDQSHPIWISQLLLPHRFSMVQIHKPCKGHSSQPSMPEDRPCLCMSTEYITKGESLRVMLLFFTDP